jgi:catechol 2,3-dioxygenase-like lactoylglutathione lyase family enzyme
MAYSVHHIHIKSEDPKATADWFAEAFGFKLLSDQMRAVGDRFIRLEDAKGVLIIVSGPRSGETLNAPATGVHRGLEHFVMETTDLRRDIDRLSAIGAQLFEGPTEFPGNIHIGFLVAPGDVRIELIQRPSAN